MKLVFLKLQTTDLKLQNIFIFYFFYEYHIQMKQYNGIFYEKIYYVKTDHQNLQLDCNV